MAREAASPVPKWKHLLAYGVSVVALACARGVPAPGFATPFDKVAPDSIRSYLDELRFDYRDGAGDEQYLIVGCPDACRLGPLVSIYPERRIRNNNNEALARGPGRIIAQLINRDSTEGYPILNLGPLDTVYWAVDSVVPADRNTSRGRSLFISAEKLRGGRAPVSIRRPLIIDEHPDEETIKGSAARWIVDTTSYPEKEVPGGHVIPPTRMRAFGTWANCKSGGCCR